jgi:hypothetical protein
MGNQGSIASIDAVVFVVAIIADGIVGNGAETTVNPPPSP